MFFFHTFPVLIRVSPWPPNGETRGSLFAKSQGLTKTPSSQRISLPSRTSRHGVSESDRHLQIFMFFVGKFLSEVMAKEMLELGFGTMGRTGHKNVGTCVFFVIVFELIHSCQKSRGRKSNPTCSLRLGPLGMWFLHFVIRIVVFLFQSHGPCRGPPLKRGFKPRNLGFISQALKKGQRWRLKTLISGGFYPRFDARQVRRAFEGNVNPGLINPYSDY